MCTYINFFPHVATQRWQQVSNFVLVVQKRLGMYKFVRTKSHTGSKFSKIFFEHLYTGWIVVVHLCFWFSLRRQMAPQQSDKFRTAFFCQFRTSVRNDSVTNYASIRTLFLSSVMEPGVLCNALNILQIRLQVAPQDSQNCGRDFAKRKLTDSEFAGNSLLGLRMVIIDIESNTSLGGLTLDPAGMHCP